MLKSSLLFALLILSGCAHKTDYKAEAAKYRTAFELTVIYRDFWFEQFSACADNNYEEARAEENYQLGLILDEGCGCD